MTGVHGYSQQDHEDISIKTAAFIHLFEDARYTHMKTLSMPDPGNTD
jgi:hypothetical protein